MCAIDSLDNFYDWSCYSMMSKEKRESEGRQDVGIDFSETSLIKNSTLSDPLSQGSFHKGICFFFEVTTCRQEEREEFVPQSSRKSLDQCELLLLVQSIAEEEEVNCDGS
jgi:hypothetical protein